MSRHHTVSIEWNAGLSIGGFLAVLHFFCSWFYVLYAICARYL
jgi:hypothetical protein